MKREGRACVPRDHEIPEVRPARRDRPRTGDPASQTGARNFAGKQRHFQVLERGAKQMLNVRARDGAALVMEMGDVKAAFERAGDDGPDRRRALKFRMAMQTDIGMPEDRVRLLTRAEAEAPAGAGLGARGRARLPVFRRQATGRCRPIGRRRIFRPPADGAPWCPPPAFRPGRSAAHRSS